MRYRNLGKTDLEVSEIGLGGNTFGPPRLDRAASIACVRRAEDLGINFVDTAIIYGKGHSESYIGEAIVGKRDRWIVATKFNLWKPQPDETIDAQIRRQCEESLSKLGTDYIDLFQLHAPLPGMSIAAIFETLGKLVAEGKVREVGLCNFSSWRHAQALDITRANEWPLPVSSQNHYNLLRRHVELETLPFCEEEQIGFLPYFPLAGGFLTDKYAKGEPAPSGTRGAAGSPIIQRSRSGRNANTQDRLKKWVQERGHTLGELAVAWLLCRPQVASVIAGVSSIEQIEANARAADWVLSDSEIAEVDELSSWDGSEETIEMLHLPVPGEKQSHKSS